jgi:hypothetical protein
MISRVCLVVKALAFLLTASLAPAQVILNDNFNGSNVSTNDGSGAVNPSSNTGAFVGSASQNVNGAYYNATGYYGNQTEVSNTGNVDSNTAFGLTATGTNFQVTANNVVVTQDGGTRPDIPGSGTAGFRFELGIVSANAGQGGDPELYNNGSGGVYVNLFYDKEGDLTGDVRITDAGKPQGDSSGTPDVIEIATFSLASATAPVAVDFDLTSTGYSISFDQAVTVSSGSLSGTFASVGITNEFNNGVRASLFGQAWGGDGAGTGNISNFNVAVAPEPPVVYLLGLGMLGLAFLGFRRTSVRA